MPEKKSVIEKLTAPPETVEEHIARLGVKATYTTMPSWREVLVIDLAELREAENNR